MLEICFTVNDPPNNSFSASDTPSFDFSVNKQRQVLKDNLAKYQIQIKRPGDTSPWEVYLDDIPIDFSTVQTSEDNKQRNDYVNKPADNSNGTYETDKLTVFYSEDSSRIKVWGKTGLEDSFPNFSSGAIQWRVAAMDIVQHHQESPSRTLRLNTLKTTINYPFFPLSVLNISGLGNPNLSTENQAAAKISYTLSSTNPVFYGIAFANAKITMALTDQDCDQSKQDDCTQIFTTTANPESRFGINLPLNSLKWGKTYTTTLGVNLGQDYNELPEFTLSLNQPATSGQ